MAIVDPSLNSRVSRFLGLHHFDAYDQAMHLIGRSDPSHLSPRDATVLVYSADMSMSTSDMFSLLSETIKQFKGQGPDLTAYDEFVSRNSEALFIGTFSDRKSDAVACWLKLDELSLGSDSICVLARHPYAALQLLRQAVSGGASRLLDTEAFGEE